MRLLDQPLGTTDAMGMDPAPATPCAACGAQVALEEVAQGLAVKVSGRLLCPLCVDRLPGDAKVAVNQMRALRGMAVTTYRYHSGRHPGLPLFTFTTAALILNHRRKQVHGEEFEAPPLPPPGSRPRLPTASEAARGDRTGWIAVAGISILIITGIVWLAVPAERPAPATPPAPVVAPAIPAVQPAPVRPAEPNYALQLTELERRLISNPDQAASIADEAELLRDAMPLRDLGLRNRADELARLARLRAAPPTPDPVAPAPRQPEPPPPVVLAPVPVPALPPRPVEPNRPEVPTPAQDPAPEQAPPSTPPVVKPSKPLGAVRWDPRILWPDRAQPLVSPDRPSPGKLLLPWPWPSGEPIWAPGLDRKRKRLVIELGFTMVGEAGGVALVLHPHRADRTTLHAVWAATTGSAPPQVLTLEPGRWQTVLVPGTGVSALDPASLRLRLEDTKDLPEDRPFLIAGAAMRSDAPPRLDDSPPRLPLLDPAEVAAANGKPLRDGDLLALLRKIAAEPLKDRQFAVANAKVLLPEVEAGRNAAFRTAMRKQLGALLSETKRGSGGIANGNPVDLPRREPAFTDAKLAWPKDALGDLEVYDAVVIGWGAEGDGEAAQFDPLVLGLLGKFLTQQPKPRRKAVLPILAVGAFERIKPDEQAAIAARWNGLARSLLARGIPVIDLRHAQREETAELVREAAAQLLVDGLRQLDWLLRR